MRALTYNAVIVTAAHGTGTYGNENTAADVDGNVVFACLKWQANGTPEISPNKQWNKRDGGRPEVKHTDEGRLDRRMTGTQNSWKATRQRNWKGENGNWRLWGADG